MAEHINEPNYYAVIPADVRYDKELMPNAKLLYGEITSLTNQKGYCYATNEYFASLYNVDSSTIKRWIKKLSDKKYIRYELDTKRYEDGTVKKIRRIYLSDTNHVVNNALNHRGENASNHRGKNEPYNNTLFNSKEKNIGELGQSDVYKEVVDYLNSKAGTKYKHSTADTRKHINARLNEGFSLDDFKKVINTKVAEWKDNEDMSKYLRPSTLFGIKFENYLNQRSKELPKNDKPRFSGHEF